MLSDIVAKIHFQWVINAKHWLIIVYICFLLNQEKMSKTILITGGAGFIGSHVVRLFVNKYPDYRIVNLDKLTYAGNLDNLRLVESSNNYQFQQMGL